MLDAVNMDDVSDSDPVKENSQESGASDDRDRGKIGTLSNHPGYQFL